MNYRRLRIPGGTYFFTQVTYDRKHLLTDLDNVNLLRKIFVKVMNDHPFRINAHVILPDHIHMIWTLPSGDDDFPTRWSVIKNLFSREMNKNLKQSLPEQRGPKGEARFWQRRYWEHVIRDETDLHNHINYIHYNPVKHGYVANPEEWGLSSFQRFCKQGFYPGDWSVSDSIKQANWYE